MLHLSFARLPFGAAMLLVAAIPNAWSADDVLDGWGEYKFGMTIEQVRAVPGIAWGETQTEEIKAGDVVTATFTFLIAATPVKFGVGDYDLRIYFEPDIGLARVNFEDKTAVKSIAECERRFMQALAVLDQRHGAFAAVAKKGKTVTPFGALNTTWRSAPTGTSTYDYLVATMQFKPQGPVHRSIELNTRRKYGNKWVSLRAISPDDKTRCEISISYVDVLA